MASFDVKSLYTNVPLAETINIILDVIFTNSNNTYHSFTKNDFKKFLELTILDTHFIFNQNLYKQIDGLAMGSPIAPILANTFLAFHETKWLEDCPLSFKPVLYRRYVDDTFLLFRKLEHTDLFLNYLNSRHPNIEFTKEIETNNSLPFLDVKISKNSNQFTTSVYRKPTYTGLTMNFNSFDPFIYKINLIKTLIYRAFHISSVYETMHEEFKKIADILSNNGYKLPLIQKQVKHFLNSIFNEKSPSISTALKQSIYFKIPFHGNESFHIRRQLNNIFKQYYPQIKINVVFTSNFKIKSFFSFKDKIPDCVRSSLVYKYTCGGCNATYIGKTSRHLSTRISEHLGQSYRTGINLSNPPFSAIREHTSNSTCNIERENFNIIATATSEIDLIIKESILIKQSNPPLNNMDSLQLRIL